jgi:hypothetical protein
MKHLLNGVAIAAALAIAAPAWAQAPMAPSSAGAPKAAAPAAAAAPMKPMAGKQRHHRMMRHHMAKGAKMSPDRMADQLNREELARLQGGGQPMAPASPQALQGPRASGK